jgi:hypothetical protein
MIAPSQSQKHYASARLRFLSEGLNAFLERELPQYFGPVLRRRLVEEIVRLIEIQLPAREFLRPGQCVWNAISDQTRPDSPRRRLVPVILTLTCQEDTQQLADGVPMRQVAQGAVARLCIEAQQQGALLSMRDIGLLVWRTNAQVSPIRQAWERAHDQILPHPGTVQDFGSCVTHKSTIIRKALIENKDPRRVARETRHSQKAVDRYLTDFHRVRTAYEQCPRIDFVCQTTGLSKNLVKQYLNLLKIKQDNEKNA